MNLLTKLKNFKFLPRILILFIFFTIYSLSSTFSSLFSILNYVYADNLSSDNYEIQFSNLNMTSGEKSSDSYIVTDTAGQTAPGEYTSTGYKVKAGFQYIYGALIPFSFTVSDISIDLGLLQAQGPSTQSATLTVSAGGAGGYQVTAIEDDQLRTSTDQIDDTQCDGAPADPCTETDAKVWIQNTTYGFGYNMQDDDIPSDFINNTYYRPFPSFTDGENSAVVMSKSGVTKESVATITFKANISGGQAGGTYQNLITFVATPAY